MRELIYKLRGVRERRWNTKIFIVSQALILQGARLVTGVQEIRQRIGKHLDAWEAGQHQMLVEETACTCDQYLYAYLHDESEEHRPRTFYSLVLRAKLRTAVFWVIELEKGGAMQLMDGRTKIGEPVIDMLRAKHPKARAPSAIILYTYPGRPLDLVPVN